jgi:Chaperone of endosialidase
MSTTTNTGLNQPTYNSTVPSWDQPLNFNETILDAVLGNTTSVSMPTGASSTTSLTGPSSSSSLGQTQAMRIVLTGALSNNQILQFPSGVAGRWIIYNTCTGTSTVTISSAGGGTSVLAPQGYNVSIYSDGTNIRYTDDGLNNNFNTLTVLGATYLATQSGNVGIGTTSPATKLDIASGTIQVSSGYGIYSAAGGGNATGFAFGANILTSYTANTERMRIDSSGNVGIGTSSPGAILDVQSSAPVIRNTATTGTNQVAIRQSNTGGYFYTGIDTSTGSYLTGAAYAGFHWMSGAYPMIFATNNSERMRINASGNVGIGTNSPSTLLTVNGTVTATSYAGSGSSLTGIVTSNAAGSGISVSGSTGAVTISNTGVTSITAGTSISVSGSTGGVTINNTGVTSITGTASQITASASTGGVTLSLPSTINVNISGSAASATSATTATTASTANALNTGNNYQVNSLGVGTGASGTGGEIRATNNITAYYSDDRLKTRLGGIQNALDKVSSLTGFYYEANETAQALGYKPIREVGISAQDVQAILPEIVAPAPIDEKYLTVRYERLVPLLIEAIKELTDRVRELEAK